MSRYDIALGKAPVPPKHHNDVPYHLAEYHRITRVAKSHLPSVRNTFLRDYIKKRDHEEISERVFKAVMKEFYKDSDNLGEIRINRAHEPEYDEDFFMNLNYS